jgi:acetyl-CoA carboxylase biotin carboxyl carrier protein
LPQKQPPTWFEKKTGQEQKNFIPKRFSLQPVTYLLFHTKQSNSMDFSQIQEIIRMVSKHKLSEFILKEGEFKLVVRNQPLASESHAPAPVATPIQTAFAPVAVPVAPAPAPKAEAAPTASNEEANYLVVKSPMVGTFYRSSTPDKPAFVKIGDHVDAGQTVCIIEAMKLFNEIESDVKGKIVKVLVEDASPVEYDQPLFLVDPS